MYVLVFILFSRYVYRDLLGGVCEDKYLAKGIIGAIDIITMLGYWCFGYLILSRLFEMVRFASPSRGFTIPFACLGASTSLPFDPSRGEVWPRRRTEGRLSWVLQLHSHPYHHRLLAFHRSQEVLPRKAGHHCRPGPAFKCTQDYIAHKTA